MKATVRLAAAQPARVATSVLADLARGAEDPARGELDPVVRGEERATWNPPDALELEGSASWIARAFEAANSVLDLPPRLLADSELPLELDDESLPPDMESRFWSFARIAAARHAPKARFEVQFGELAQLASAWLAGGVAEVRRLLEQDLRTEVGPVTAIRIALGPGDSFLGLDFTTRQAHVEARHPGGLEALDLARHAALDAPAFRSAQRTFQEASATPSEAAERERNEIEQGNAARRTGYLLARPDAVPGTLVRQLGLARVRAYLEGPAVPWVPLEVRAAALEKIPTPGRARSIVRLLVDARGEQGFDTETWLTRLGEEPEPAATAGFEELILLGVEPERVAESLTILDPRRAARALARACTEGDAEVRDRAGEALAALGPARVAEAFDPLPSFRGGLEACWEVVRGFGAGSERHLAPLITRLQTAAEQLADSDPSARFLAARVAEARGDEEGAARYFELAGERATDPRLAARARMGAAMLAFRRGRIEDAISSLLETCTDADGGGHREAMERIATCFRELDLGDFARFVLPPEEEEPVVEIHLELVRAWLASRSGRYEKAVETFAHVHAARPLSGDPVRVYAASLRAAGRDPEALALLREDCRNSPGDAESWYQLARLHHEAEEPQACLEPLAGALAADPDHARALHLEGVVREAIGDLEGAARAFGRAVEVAPEMPSAFGGLGRVYVSLNRFEEAAGVYRRSLDVAEECRLPGYRELGRLYELHLDDPEQALYWYQRYLTNGGEDAEILERFKEVSKKISTYPRTVSRGVSG